MVRNGCLGCKFLLNLTVFSGKFSSNKALKSVQNSSNAMFVSSELVTFRQLMLLKEALKRSMFSLHKLRFLMLAFWRDVTLIGNKTKFIK